MILQSPFYSEHCTNYLCEVSRKEVKSLDPNTWLIQAEVEQKDDNDNKYNPVLYSLQ